MHDLIRLVIHTTRSMFSGWALVAWIAFYAVVGGLYFYIISLNVPLSIFVGLIFAFPFCYAINVLGEQRKKRVQELHMISKYVQTLVFYLKSGKNVLYSYEATKEMMDEALHADLQRTIDTLKFNGILDVSHFERYDLKVLDLFHTNLMIKSTSGGESKEIFKHTTKDINMEISKRDELNRIKDYVCVETYMMLAMVMSIPIILSMSAEIVYIPFAENTFVQPVLVLYFLCVYLIVYYMNKRRLDTDVTH